MSQFFTGEEARAYRDTDVKDLVPANIYKVKITSIEAADSDPERKCFKFRVVSGPYARRVLRAWPSTAPDRIWTMKKLIGAVVVDPSQLQLEDLEGHVFMAEVAQRERSDNHEMTNDVVRLTPCIEDDEGAAPSDDEDVPF